VCVVQISMRCEAHQKKYPDAKVISLGMGDTTQPIPSILTSTMTEVHIYPFLSSLKQNSLFISYIVDAGELIWVL
jgi:hypothetical protein